MKKEISALRGWLSVAVFVLSAIAGFAFVVLGAYIYLTRG